MSVKIDKEKCNLCGQCINMCIMRQIKIENNETKLSELKKDISSSIRTKIFEFYSE